MVRRNQLVRVRRREADHFTVMLVSEHAVSAFNVERVRVRIKRYHIVAVAYLAVGLPAVRRENFGVFREAPVVPRERIPNLIAGVFNARE